MIKFWQVFADDFNIRKQARELGIPLWQAPGFLFIILGIIIIGVMTAVYFASQKYALPEILVLSEATVVAVLLTIGNFIIQSIEQMAAVNKMKSEFVSIASHQLKAPLAEINWEIELLLTKNREGLSAKQKELIERIDKSNGRMGRLVNDLLDVARIEQGKLMLAKEKTDILRLVNQTIDNNKVLAQANNVEIQVTKPGGLPEINIDRRRIGVVLDNLISNAIKYIRGKGWVKIEVSPQGNKALICIKDNGVGIPSHEQNRVFEKFFRSGNAVRYQVSGTGLGLYIAKNVVEQSGGKIWFKSKENVGSEFCFSLPAEINH